MPRRGRSAPAPSRNLPARAPAPAPPAHVQPPPATSQGPGLFGQMAATAGGVAVGSAIGHTVGHAVTGMFSGGGSSEAPAQQAPPQQLQQPQQYGRGAASLDTDGPCGWEIKQFLECAATQSDLSLCQGFNEAIQQCKIRNNLSV
ncbi:coiled-coil-helix-coiled-coil-helix domain-containing protein 10, mitochondrial [Diorhabda carinulata]|uniref:coiled-coil-helix-coiled-coil-helix domain-containing protein 10, mitochondrial n=1 Tax=Diorhabda carinulata TaxID=1163345 RepID=UPI0025A246B3|nr:coiled-coil-helix-coiled-coil-helix domain-containing protein 10, mitochondrial [Diorhabda carinulata]